MPSTAQHFLSPRSKRPFSVRGATVVVANIVLVTLVGLPGSARADTPDPILLRGEVPSGTLAVEIQAQPGEASTKDQPMRSIRVPVDATLSDGQFAARVDPMSIPVDAIRPDGLVDFEVIARGADGQSSSWTTARMVSVSSSIGWVDPVTSSATLSSKTPPLKLDAGGVTQVPVIKSDQAGLSTNSILDGGGVVLEAFPPVADALASADPEAQAGSQSTDDGASQTAAKCRYEYWNYTKTRKTRKTTIGTTYPYGIDTARMNVESSMGARYGMAASATGAYVGFHASGSRFVKSGWGKKWNATSKQRAYRKGIEYQLMRKQCYGSGTVSAPRFIWRPVGETGGESVSDGLTRPGWNKCTKNSPGAWHRTGSGGTAYAFGTAVKMKGLIGIDLSIKRNYSGKQRLTYYLKKKRRLCGNNGDWPSTAGKIIDRAR